MSPDTRLGDRKVTERHPLPVVRSSLKPYLSKGEERLFRSAVAFRFVNDEGFKFVDALKTEEGVPKKIHQLPPDQKPLEAGSSSRDHLDSASSTQGLRPGESAAHGVMRAVRDNVAADRAVQAKADVADAGTAVKDREVVRRASESPDEMQHQDDKNEKAADEWGEKTSLPKAILAILGNLFHRGESARNDRH